MKSMNQARKGSTKKRGIRMRTAQKQSINYAVVSASVIVMLTGAFIYFNFFNSSSSHAENSLTAYHPTYTTTDAAVPVRLLIKPDNNARALSNANYKNDTAYVAKPLGRGQSIDANQYVTE